MLRSMFRSATTVAGAAVLGAAVAVAGVVGATELMTPTASVSTSDDAGAENAAADAAPANAPLAGAHPDGDDASMPCEERVEQFLDRLPDNLVTDLRALKDVAPDERRDAVRELRQNALDGEYGDRAQDFVESGMARQLWQQLPVELRQDLREIAQLPTAEIPDALMELLDDAVAGEYGAMVQMGAEKIQTHVEDCLS